MTLSRNLRSAALMLVLICTVGCDQGSKHLARTALSQTDAIALPGRLAELKLAENPGSFLSLGDSLPAQARFAILTLGVGVGLIALAIYLTRRAPIDAMRFIGLSLVLAGGSSNLLDRIFRHGRVTDFITIHIGPIHTGVFNAADFLIIVGIGVVICAHRKTVSPNGPAIWFMPVNSDSYLTFGGQRGSMLQWKQTNGSRRHRRRRSSMAGHLKRRGKK